MQEKKSISHKNKLAYLNFSGHTLQNIFLGMLLCYLTCLFSSKSEDKTHDDILSFWQIQAVMCNSENGHDGYLD